MVAVANEEGDVHCAGVTNLARMCNLPLDCVEDSLKRLAGPDPHSSNPDNEGRRIEVFPWGYRLLNKKSYNELNNRERQREQTRERVRKYRETKKSNAQKRYKSLPSVTPTSTVTVTSTVKREKESVREKGKKETRFSKSPVATWEKFRAGLADWEEGRARFYFDLFEEKEALTPSKYLYADWIRAARAWDRRDPEQWKKGEDPKKHARGISEIIRGKK